MAQCPRPPCQHLLTSPGHASRHRRFVWKNQWKIKETAAAWRGTGRCGRRQPTLQNSALAAAKRRELDELVHPVPAFSLLPGRPGEPRGAALAPPPAPPGPWARPLAPVGKAAKPLRKPMRIAWCCAMPTAAPGESSVWRCGATLQALDSCGITANTQNLNSVGFISFSLILLHMK